MSAAEMRPKEMSTVVLTNRIEWNSAAATTLNAAARFWFVAAVAGLVLLVVSSAMGQIYKTAVYLYAETGEIAGYSSELLEGAFRDKTQRRRFFG